MRELILNGYIDDDVWYGDEITPETLHESLYGANNENTDDVHIRLNSYGGSCNAAVRMYDDIRAYPGTVSITVSGTAASAATMLCMAADHLEITPGSLFMIHDPSMMAFGNEHDLNESIQVLRACKESILNMYERRVRAARIDVAAMMTACTWFDANSALQYGFVDRIVDDPVKYPQNSIEEHVVYIDKAKEAVQAWEDRMHHPKRYTPAIAAEPCIPAVAKTKSVESEPITNTAEEPDAHNESGSSCVLDNPVFAGPVSHPDRVKVTATDMRLEDLKY